MPFGIFNGMTNTLSIDKAGRVVIPQTIRKMFGLNAGSTLKLEIKDQAMTLTPMCQYPSMTQENGLWVHEGIPQDSVYNTVASDRDARISKMWGLPT